MTSKTKLRSNPLHIAPNHFAYSPKSSFLVESTGHRKVAGKWVGDDRFYVFDVEEKPGFGASRNFTHVSNYRPEGVSINDLDQSWRPTLCRFYSIGTGTTNSRIDDTQIPVPTYDPFSEYTLKFNNYGADFIKRARPGNLAAPLGQFLGELHDLPRLPLMQALHLSFLRKTGTARLNKVIADSPKVVGSEFLNVEFGWKPFVSDLKKIYALWKGIDTRLAQLVRDNGLSIRRKRQLERTSSKETLANFDIEYPFDWTFGVDGPHLEDVPIPQDDDLSCFKVSALRGVQNTGESSIETSHGHFKLVKTSVENVWGRGTFRYDVPDIGSSEWTHRAIAALYDANVTPALLWELYPWSWLIDWFSNVGSVLSNLQSNAVDHETYSNMFVMYRKTDTYTATLDVNWEAFDDGYSGCSAGSDSLTWTRTENWSMRSPASPYGFGVDFSSLSAAKQVILAALGMSQGSSSFNKAHRLLRKAF